MELNSLDDGEYVEPYAGGAGIAMELIAKTKVKRVHLNDSSYPIFSFWYCVKHHAAEICRRVACASLDIDEWRRQRDIFRLGKLSDRIDLGYATLFLNRCNRSGILTAGVIGGLQQKGNWGIDARFPRSEIIRRIEVLAENSSRIRLRNWDAERYITNYLPRLPQNVLVYCDPPYFKKAERLYNSYYMPSDHSRIASLIQSNIVQPWIVSYDNEVSVENVYRKRRQIKYNLQYNAARAYQGKELMIFSDRLSIPFTSELKNFDSALQAVHL